MSLLVGHTCAGCGLDIPELTCDACEGHVIWDVYQGAHCEDCGKSIATVTCAECGRESDI